MRTFRFLLSIQCVETERYDELKKALAWPHTHVRYVCAGHSKCTAFVVE